MIEFKQQPVSGTQTLWRHLHRRFEAETVPGLLASDALPPDYNPPAWLERFLAFCDVELANNPVLATGYGDTGMTVTLADGTYLLLHTAAATPHARPERAFGVGITDPNPSPRATATAEYGSIRVTDPFREGCGPG